MGRSKYPGFFNNESAYSLGENIKVNQGAYFIGAATLFFAGSNCFEHGSKVGPIPLLHENVKKYLVKMLTHQNKRTILQK